MSTRRRSLAGTLIVRVIRHAVAGVIALVALGTGVTRAEAQAWVPPAGVGSVTFITQAIDHTGHILTDGTKLPVGQSTTVGLDVQVDYAFTDRFSMSAGLPYVFAKFRDRAGAPPGIPFLPVDSCFCVHSDWQDFTVTARYNLMNVRRGFALTPAVSAGLPSHDYNYQGEAVVGRRLKELRLSVAAGQHFAVRSSRLSVQGQYSYAVVERTLDLPNNRSNVSVDVSVALTRRLTARGLLLGQRTHGGLRYPDEIVSFPDRVIEHDRLLRDNNLRLGAGVSYSWPAWHLSATYIGFTRGSDSHTLRALGVSASWLFRVGED